MSALLVLGQSSTEDTSSAAAAVFGMMALIGVVSIFAITRRGRRSLMPAVAMLLGFAITITTIGDAIRTQLSIITILGLFIGVTLLLGGFGALREGVAIPPVEGVEPEIEPRSPRVLPPDVDRT